MTSSIPAQTLEKFVTFGDLLRFLRRRTGLTQMELAIAVGYSDAQISRLEQNLRLPDIPTIQARFVPALDLEEDPKAVARLLDLAANVRREDAPGLGLPPYKGLNYYDEMDADLFAGRETLTAELVNRLLAMTTQEGANAERILVIIGASGSGKSSLVRAGLVPGLRWNSKSAHWPVHVIKPTPHPLESLAASLTNDTGSLSSMTLLMDDLERDPRSLNMFVNRLLKFTGASRLVLIVDQFEELFTLCRSETEREAFIDNLLMAAGEVDGSVITVIALRADFYAHCARYPNLRAALTKNQVYIGAMSGDELHQAIEEPALRGHWELEPGLVNLLLSDVGSEPGALPLLSHALLETWQRRRGRLLTLSGYTSSGGVRGAIAETAEAVFIDQFSHEQQAIARRIFLRLTELGDEMALSDTRRRAEYSELILKPEEKAATLAVLKALADARLITTYEASAEVAHEALIREWPRLRSWLEDNRDGLRLHRQMTEIAQEWLAADRDPDILYRGARLAQAREWAAAHSEEMNLQESEFLDASILLSERELAEREAQRERELQSAQKLALAEKQRAEEQAQTARQLNKRAIFLAIALLLAMAMAFFALFLGAQARRTAIAAQDARIVGFARELAAESINNLQVDPELSILLAMQAISTTYTTQHSATIEAEYALHRALEASRLELTLRGHSSAVWAAAFSPDGARLATASDDGVVIIWDAASGKELLTLQTNATSGGHGIDFSPDGRRLATPGDIGTARIWDASTGAILMTLIGHTKWVSGVAFSPDGRRLATGSDDLTAKVWDAVTGQELLTLQGHSGAVNAVVFSPDSKLIATASDDGTAMVWDASTGAILHIFRGYVSAIEGIAFSPDGARLAIAGLDKIAKVLDVANGQEQLILRGHTEGVFDVIFSPDGRRLATASGDQKAKVWDAATGQPLLTFSGNRNGLTGVVFSPDCLKSPGALAEQCGTRLATTSLDGTTKVWNTSFSQDLLTFSVPEGDTADFSSDGTRLVTASADGAIQLWDTTTGLQINAETREELLSLPIQEGVLTGIAFSPDGKRLATSGEGRGITIWDLTSGAELRTLSGGTGSIYGITFSPDGARLAINSGIQNVKIWDAAGGRLLLTLPVPAWPVSVTFNRDGTRLAAGRVDGFVSVWDANTGKELKVIQGNQGEVWSLSFSPDGKQLATAGEDGTGKLLDIETGEELFNLSGHIGAVKDIKFSPDGSRLATAGQDGTVREWDAHTGRELITYYGHTDTVYKIAFNTDGTRLLTASDNGLVRVYLRKVSELMALAATRLTRTLSTAECQRYLHLSAGQCETQIEPSQPALVASQAGNASVDSPAGKHKVCEVTDIYGFYDNFYNHMAYEGLLAAAAQYGWDSSILESRQISDYQANINRHIQSGCDLIVLPASHLFGETIIASAADNPSQKFMTYEWERDQQLEGVWNQFFAEDQAAFLAGYLAGSVSKTGKVGVFGGMEYPTVIRFMEGFTLGVAYYNKMNAAQVEVIGWDIDKHEGLFTGNFTSLEDGRKVGQELMDQGVDIILPVAGPVGRGTAEAIKERGGAYLIGVDTDWVVNLPEFADFILTSIVKRFDVTVQIAVGAIIDGTFQGGVHVATLENGGVGLAPYHNLDGLVSPKIKADLEKIKAGIVAGEIKTKP